MSSLFLPRIARDYSCFKPKIVAAFCNGYSPNIQSNNPQEIVGWMRNYAPAFEVQSDAISVLNEPSEFYNTLRVRRS